MSPATPRARPDRWDLGAAGVVLLLLGCALVLRTAWIEFSIRSDPQAVVDYQHMLDASADPWGRELRLETQAGADRRRTGFYVTARYSPTGKISYSPRHYSAGPDGVYDDGDGDDLFPANTVGLGLVLYLVGPSMLLVVALLIAGTHVFVRALRHTGSRAREVAWSVLLAIPWAASWFTYHLIRDPIGAPLSKAQVVEDFLEQVGANRLLPPHVMVPLTIGLCAFAIILAIRSRPYESGPRTDEQPPGC